MWLWMLSDCLPFFHNCSSSELRATGTSSVTILRFLVCFKMEKGNAAVHEEQFHLFVSVLLCHLLLNV